VINMDKNISLISGNIFHSEMQTIAITVNCVGVMGKGIALEMKNKSPEAYQKYRDLCSAGKMNMGESIVYDEDLESLNGKKLLFFPTKSHWKTPSKLFEIKSGLKYFAENHGTMGIESIAFPALGCGNGGLNWNDVKPAMYEYLEDLDIEIEIYEPVEQTKSNLSKKQTETKPNPKPSKITDY
jgi:O-acetyl-ADP-ribose deacetylase (regulator of RNase III)